MSDQLIYEVKPRREALERALSLLSVKTTTPKKDAGSSGIPDMTAADAAAACAGYHDPIGRHIIGALMGERKEIEGMVEQLDRLGWIIWRERSITGWITVPAHRKLASAAVFEFLCNDRTDTDHLCKWIGIKREKKRHILTHLDELRGLLLSKQSDLARHLGRRMRGSE